MTRSISNIISWVFHPVLIPLWGIILIFNSGSYISHLNWEAKRVILGIVFFATILMPLATVSLLYYQQIIKDFTGKNGRDRMISIAAFTLFYIFCWYLLNKLPISRHIQFYMMNLSLLSIFCLIVSIKWNLSIHMAGIGALSGSILAFTFSRGLQLEAIIMILFIASGLTGYARLINQKNTPVQVYLSYLLGFGVLFTIGYFI